MGAMINGLAFGFLVSIMASLYVDTFIGNVIPIWITYGIFAPFLSALAITVGIYVNKEKRDRYFVPGYEEKKEE